MPYFSGVLARKQAEPIAGYILLSVYYFLKAGIISMALIGQNSILGNFPSSFEYAYARAGYSFSFAFGKGIKWGLNWGDI